MRSDVRSENTNASFSIKLLQKAKDFSHHIKLLEQKPSFPNLISLLFSFNVPRLLTAKSVLLQHAP